MKVQTHLINWHEKQPVYSLDWQPILNDPSSTVDSSTTNHIQRLATAGADCNVRIWSVSACDKVQYLATLTRHTSSVNCVRWSPNGTMLASGGDDGLLLLWKLSEEPVSAFSNASDSAADVENWKVVSALRGGNSDIYDFSWSPCSRYIITACIDNSCRIFEVGESKCIFIINDHTHFVQGVAWDPLSERVASMSTDRSMIITALKPGKGPSGPFKVSRIQKVDRIPTVLASSSKANASAEAKDSDLAHEVVLVNETKKREARMYHDETLTCFFRRLSFSLDGSFLLSPAGLYQENPVVFIHARHHKDPIACIPHSKPATNIKFNPNFFVPRAHQKGDHMPWSPLPYRMIFAVLTLDSLFLYDTQSLKPLLSFSNYHFTCLTDMAWSSDGLKLGMCSSDGFVTLIEFESGELGEVMAVKPTLGTASSLNASLSVSCANEVYPQPEDVMVLDEAVVQQPEVEALEINEEMKDVPGKENQEPILPSECSPCFSIAKTVVFAPKDTTIPAPGKPVSSSHHAPVQRTLYDLFGANANPDAKRVGSAINLAEKSAIDVSADISQSQTITSGNDSSKVVKSSSENASANLQAPPKKRRITPMFIGTV